MIKNWSNLSCLILSNFLSSIFHEECFENVPTCLVFFLTCHIQEENACLLQLSKLSRNLMVVRWSGTYSGYRTLYPKFNFLFLFSNIRSAAAARERADARGLHRRRRPPRLHDGRHPRQVRKKELGREVGGKANIVSIESQGEQSLRTFTLRRIPTKVDEVK